MAKSSVISGYAAARRAAIVAVLFSATVARADIYQWEYVNPGNPGDGKQQSATLCYGGSGAEAIPFANLSYRILSMAYLIGKDMESANFDSSNLTNADLSQANLTNANFWNATLEKANFTQANLTNSDCAAKLANANFSQANLTNASFYNPSYGSATLTNAVFAGALVRGANFNGTTAKGFTAGQLYSTSSYKAHDLTGLGLYNNNLTGWNFAGKTLTNASFGFATLKNANLSQANLTNASFVSATLTNADFTGAQVNGANFTGTTAKGFTAAKLYSTASYQAHDLTGISLGANDLVGWNFAGQILTNASFWNASGSATLTDADFTGARVQGANFDETTARGFTAEQLYSTASYQAHDLAGIGLDGNNLTGWDFAGQNLTNASFRYTPSGPTTLTNVNFSRANLTSAYFFAATLTNAEFRQANLTNAYFYASTLMNADFTGAQVQGANLVDATTRGFTAAQLYSTASYQAHDLTRIKLNGNDLTGWDLAGQNLANASFGSATLIGTNVSGADARGAKGISSIPGSAITTNLIRPDGRIAGLNLNAGEQLVIRDYDGNPTLDPAGPPIAIQIDQHFEMASGGTLRIILEADTWNSTISFVPGINVSLGGSLELAFADGVDLAGQIGRTFDLFDWTGVTATGTFDVAGRYTWDLSRLYATGEVTLLSIGSRPGDFNSDGDVDGADFVAWQTHFPLTSGGTLADGDADGDGDVDGADFVVWQVNFASVPSPISSPVPEPASVFILASCIVMIWPSRTCRFKAIE